MSDTMSGAHCSVSRSISMVREAFVASVTWTPPSTPPLRFHSSQVSMVPKIRSPASARGPRAVDVVEQPAHLRPGEVGRQRQSDPVAVPLGTAAQRAELVADRLRAGVLPDDRGRDRLAGGAVPDHRRLALVGDADRGHVSGAQLGSGQRAGHHRSRVRPDLGRRRAPPSPARGSNWRCSTCSTATIVASWSNRMQRDEVVPWSIAATTDGVAAMVRACQKRGQPLR